MTATTAAVTASAAVIARAPDILEDLSYRTIRRELSTALQTSSDKLRSAITTPHFFLDWEKMCALFNANKAAINPLHDRVRAWNPHHEDGIAVKELALAFFQLFEHPEEDRREAAIAKGFTVVMFVEQHNAMQEERDRAIQEEQMEKMRAFEAHQPANDPSLAYDRVPPSSAAFAQTTLSQTAISSTELFNFRNLKSLIPAEWTTKDANFAQLAKQSHPELDQALLYAWTHPAMIEIQNACFNLKSLFAQAQASPNIDLGANFQLAALQLQLALEKGNLLIELQNCSQLSQQVQNVQAKREEEIFSTMLSADEAARLFQTKELIEAIWPDGTLYEMALFFPHHSQFPAIQVFINDTHTHPILLDIQKALKTLIEILQSQDSSPEVGRVVAYNQSMQTIHRLISQDVWSQLQFS